MNSPKVSEMYLLKAPRKALKIAFLTPKNEGIQVEERGYGFFCMQIKGMINGTTVPS
jgi:hypothetical protein